MQKYNVLLTGYKLQKNQCSNGDETDKQRVLLGTCRGKSNHPLPCFAGIQILNRVKRVIFFSNLQWKQTTIHSPILSHCVCQREEEERKEEERRRAVEERRRLEKERVLKERRDAEERDRKMNEKLQMIEEQRLEQSLFSLNVSPCGAVG